MLAGVVVSLLVLGVFEAVVARVHPSFEPPREMSQTSLRRFIGTWERYWFKYGIGSHGTSWGMRQDLERTYGPPAVGVASLSERRLTPSELEQTVRSDMRRLEANLDAVLLWACLAWPVGWLAFFVASILTRLAWASGRVSDRLRSEGWGRASRRYASLSMMIFASAGLVLVCAVLLPVTMVQGDVPTGLMSAPLLAGWLTVWGLKRRQAAAKSEAVFNLEALRRAQER